MLLFWEIAVRCCIEFIGKLLSVKVVLDSSLVLPFSEIGVTVIVCTREIEKSLA